MQERRGPPAKTVKAKRMHGAAVRATDPASKVRARLPFP
jgi:hypothetical protein